MNTVNTTPTTVVLLDPTHHDGEAPLDALGDDDRHVAVVVLSPPSAKPNLLDTPAALTRPQ